jgi:hypothetical protein
VVEDRRRPHGAAGQRGARDGDSVRLARTISLMETLDARRDTIESKIS